MRLIDADDYIYRMQQSMHNFDDYPLVKYGLEVAILAMDRMPTIDAEPLEAFRLLCKSLKMDYVCDEDTSFEVHINEDGKRAVYVIHDGKEELFDDRGALFILLRNVAVMLCPNVAFRGERYIYDWDGGSEC